MPLLPRIKDFCNRHRKHLVIGSVIISGTMCLVSFTRRKISDIREKELINFVERSKRHQHFVGLNRTSNQSILNLSNSLYDALNDINNTNHLIHQIKSQPTDKIELWELLKIKVFAKACCSVYAVVLFVITIKIQLSVVGGHLYNEFDGLPSEKQQQYLMMSQLFLQSGLKKMHQCIETQTKRIFGDLHLKKSVMMSDLESLIWSLQVAVATNANNPLDKPVEYVFPKLSQEYGNCDHMLRDTIDLLESDDVKALFTHCTHRGFRFLLDNLSYFFVPNGVLQKETLEANSQPVQKKAVAKLIPIINSLISQRSFLVSLFEQLLAYEKIEALSANIYESLLTI